ncbi:peptidyl-prolyl cis-trans isomerase FKBP16-4, chloroplastic isoform X3 [Beta vulgaris subsp. vulgaris]|uniref:peptidyl-prolyl cis-trans isomerase FKBP16-4, chloroplastic isoform X3 n=1 Tax=Beta vulgaris subsp. vulgaris TaxID=3555 RepID=UPI002036C6B9|nr:peptidyl-prolyl cis-trans isomerase FKBP16-4, chloroplastic isoform X3 [Beta vulgaris subsp. vulgaris]
MELTLFSHHHSHFTHKSTLFPSSNKIPSCRNVTVLCCSCSSNHTAKPITLSLATDGRRAFMNCFLIAAAGLCIADVAGAVSTSRRALRGAKIPESEFTTLSNGLKLVHYVAKWKGITFMTSRQGMGVGGGTPYGFDIGQSERGTVLKGLDLGVEGMKVGGQRLLIVPPQLAYGSKGVQEIPPNATIELDVELLSIKQSPFGSPVKLVEG